MCEPQQQQVAKGTGVFIPKVHAHRCPGKSATCSLIHPLDSPAIGSKNVPRKTQSFAAYDRSSNLFNSPFLASAALCGQNERSITAAVHHISIQAAGSHMSCADLLAAGSGMLSAGCYQDETGSNGHSGELAHHDLLSTTSSIQWADASLYFNNIDHDTVVSEELLLCDGNTNSMGISLSDAAAAASAATATSCGNTWNLVLSSSETLPFDIPTSFMAANSAAAVMSAVAVTSPINANSMPYQTAAGGSAVCMERAIDRELEELLALRRQMAAMRSANADFTGLSAIGDFNCGNPGNLIETAPGLGSFNPPAMQFQPDQQRMNGLLLQQVGEKLQQLRLMQQMQRTLEMELAQLVPLA